MRTTHYSLIGLLLFVLISCHTEVEPDATIKNDKYNVSLSMMQSLAPTVDLNDPYAMVINSVS